MGRNGKSRALICFVLCMIMALPVYFSSAVAVKAAEQQTIIIGTNAEYSPFEYLDDDGNIINTVTKEYPIYFPKPGWSEQNPVDWYDKTAEGIRELTCDIKAEDVAGISFGGQMHGLVVLDKDDNVIRPAILWNDGRTTKECDYLNNVYGKDKLTANTANIAFAGFTAPKILWIKENEPDNFARISKIMLPKDYLAYRMSGEFATDVSDASGMLLFNVKRRCWSDEMINVCGIKKEQLANIYESYECIGHLTETAACELGLTTAVKVIAGAGDNAAAAVGTGTVGDGMCNISLGTSGTIFIASKTFGVDENNALHSFAHADGYYHLMGCMLSAASCNKWWLDDIIKDNDYEKEQAGISQQCLGNNNVFFLPYLMGERSPHNNPLARGSFIGMTMDTTRYDMTQAVPRYAVAVQRVRYGERLLPMCLILRWIYLRKKKARHWGLRCLQL